MAKLKLSKGELKRQRDALSQYQRYLPTLQLKKQQLQIEILSQQNILREKETLLEQKRAAIAPWLGLLADKKINNYARIAPERMIATSRNIAGVDLPLFERLEFAPAEYDLFLAPLWVDTAIAELRTLVALEEELKVIEKGITILRQELRITTQRVNLFEKVKIPAAEEAIRMIKIYLGDQMANAVGRSKIAKRKIEVLELAGAAV
ncbi:MAG: V-type ATP synthase subunit D [Candidatus Omnitrophica bacterium]|nr:V-type ATP synthase subunit D [Candidatus Omnitrophota bacterium]